MTETATPRFLSDVYEAASQCNKCSLCQAVCPTYVVNPVEWETARGRVSLIRDAIEGRIELREIADGPLSTCLTCDNCVAACAPRVPTAQIVSRARQELHEQEGYPFGQRLFLRGVLPRPGALRILRRLSRLTQVTGLRSAAIALGLPSLLGTFGYVAHTVQSAQLPKKTARQRIKELPDVAQPIRGQVLVMTCCYQNDVAPDATLATLRVLRLNGFDTIVPEMGCFGLPAKTLGDGEAMEEMALRTTEAVSGIEVDGIIGDSASCVSHVQGYDDIIGKDRSLGSQARQLANRVSLASVFLQSHGFTAELGPLNWKVAIDLPCSLPIDGPVRDVASQVLGLVPGLELLPLHEDAMCCGGPGLYAAQQQERSAAILQRKFENVVKSGAEVLVTENVSCLLQLRQGAKLYAPNVRVMHLMEVLDHSMTAAQRRRPLV